MTDLMAFQTTGTKVWHARHFSRGPIRVDHTIVHPDDHRRLRDGLDHFLQGSPRYLRSAFDWLFAKGFTPILAHPERSPTRDDFEKHLERIVQQGVLLQGNLRCFTGEEGHYPDQTVRQYMGEGRYTLLALDMHRPNVLQGRLDGIALAAEEFGEDRVEAMIDNEVRRLLF